MKRKKKSNGKILKPKKAVIGGNKIPEISIDKAVEFLGNGYSISETKVLMHNFQKEQGLSTSINYIARIVSEAGKELIGEHEKDRRHIISLHVQRYNREIVKLLNFDNPWEREYNGEDQGEEESNDKDDKVNKYELREKLIAKYFTALQCILQKEKVLQMHTKGFLINITNKITANEAAPVSDFKLTSLSLEEKSDFLALILKTKKNEYETGTVILKEKQRNEDIEEVEYVEVKEEPNINKIKHLPSPKQEDTGSTLLDINEKLKLALQQKAIEEFKSAGSKTIEIDESKLRQLQPTKINSK